MLDYLSNRPHIGVVFGMSSGFFYSIGDFLTKDTTLKAMSDMGIYLGVIVAFISLFAKVLEVSRHFNKRRK